MGTYDFFLRVGSLPTYEFVRMKCEIKKAFASA